MMLERRYLDYQCENWKDKKEEKKIDEEEMKRLMREMHKHFKSNLKPVNGVYGSLN